MGALHRTICALEHIRAGWTSVQFHRPAHFGPLPRTDRIVCAHPDVVIVTGQQVGDCALVCGAGCCCRAPLSPVCKVITFLRVHHFVTAFLRGSRLFPPNFRIIANYNSTVVFRAAPPKLEPKLICSHRMNVWRGCWCLRSRCNTASQSPTSARERERERERGTGWNRTHYALHSMRTIGADVSKQECGLDQFPDPTELTALTVKQYCWDPKRDPATHSVANCEHTMSGLLLVLPAVISVSYLRGEGTRGRNNLCHFSC